MVKMTKSADVTAAGGDINSRKVKSVHKLWKAGRQNKTENKMNFL